MAAAVAGGGWMWMEWRWFARLWVRVGEWVVAGGRSVVVVSSSAVLGGGMAHTMLVGKGAGVVEVVAAVAVEPGMVEAGGLGVVGRSAGSEMVSGGGKGRKQGMDE